MKNTVKRITALLACALLLVTLAGCGKKSGGSEATPAPYSCTVTIDASRAYNYAGLDSAIRDKLANDGLLLKDAVMSGFAQHTVTQVTKNACSTSGLLVDVQDGEYGSFFIGIGGLHNGDCGESSYWLLKINGEFPETGTDSITVKDGDKIEWVYTCDGGADVGYTMSAE